MSGTLVTKFSKKCIKALNDQINAELQAGYVYQAFSIYFSRHDVALHNVSAFFKKASDEERQHADVLIAYLNKRGGDVVLHDIKAPKNKSVTLLAAFEQAFELEKEVHKKLRSVHEVASDENEAHFVAFLEEEFLAEQIDAEDSLAADIANIKRLGKGLGEYMFDKNLKS